MTNNSKLLVAFGILLALSMYSVHMPKKGPTTPVKKSGTLTISQVMEFYVNSTGNNIKTNIAYTSDPQHINANELGVCLTYQNGDKQILINDTQWKTLSDNERIWVVFHEIGHCDFGLKHVDHDHDLMSPHNHPQTIGSFVRNFDNVVKLLAN